MIKYSAIDLQSLQSIYDTDILPYEYHYELDDGTFVSVRFEQSQLAHLLGIQKVDHSRADLKGQKCYDEIRNGNLTFTKLKAINRSRVAQECKDKMRYFDELPNLLDSPDCVEFDVDASGKRTRIRMKFALKADRLSSGKTLILGVDTTGNRSDYFPRTWLIEPMGSNILDGQSVRTVVSVQKLSR